MEQLNARKDGLTAQLTSAGADHAALAKVTTELASVQADLASTEDEWLALSAQLEIAEG